ncbi:flagellar export protein FliJ [Priestia flexa]|uniref:flagellar export protein FliJ n=1 Tax=Priestia flexa TaxID=86664 RepID=UPI0009567866|nr:flagellar export protein FliJ [Priestia flexa]AQX54049.1 flagellar export protein FliJ [Priestia flexa]MBY6084792.1 flagellar export protein FliJ [Priestia flexa]MCM3065576.1 flagellar export protein FliJ [Priestia flexa]MCP1190282.1 flagellar export protein FliJ [Priestia flexa]WEZ09897.1 flagellar export protein FliJ [Priestia flexa]
MTYQFKLAKVMTVKQDEKNRLLAQYNESVQHFEQVGQRLYDKLKQKEEMLELQAKKLKSGLAVSEIKFFQQALESIEATIARLQRDVMLARQQMSMKELKLQEKNIECKKYEKLKDKSYTSYLKTQGDAESKQMDEISLQQFMLHRN